MIIDSKRANLWDETYRRGDTPWDAGMPDEEIVKIIEKGILKPCRVLDVGCGTGNEVVCLAKRGFEVVGIDISEFAIKTAREKAHKEKVKCKFHFADALDLSFLKENSFDLIFDRACFHFLEPSERGEYIENIKRVLANNGKFLLIVSSNHDIGITGPYKFSKKDIEGMFGKDFKILEMRVTILKHHKLKLKPYICLMEKKDTSL